MNKNRLTMGKVFLAAGLIIKALFVILAALNAEFAQGIIGVMLPTCIMIGGFSVFAYERRGITGVMSMLCAVASLLSVSMTTVSARLAAIAYFSLFFLFAILLLTMRHRTPRYFIVAAIVFFALLMVSHYASFVTIKDIGITIVIALLHTLMALGLFV